MACEVFQRRDAWLRLDKAAAWSPSDKGLWRDWTILFSHPFWCKWPRLVDRSASPGPTENSVPPSTLFCYLISLIVVEAGYLRAEVLTHEVSWKSPAAAVWLLSRVQLFCDPADCSAPGFSVRGISQAGIVEWVAISFSRESPAALFKTQIA